MKVPRHILAEAIAKQTLHISDDKRLAQEIAAYLLEERRTAELESILRDIMQYRTDHGVLEAEVVTAHGIKPLILDEVKALLHADYPGAKTIHVGTRQDPSVVGGLRIDMANQQLDMSIAGKLATFKRLTSGEGTK
ncbi:MAG TPA: F0F1 ATP synthase subunit delta [Candidatus Saccharimonadales bacterium]|nr:F0F1 ATP synthase subunit delta [Candidatus Saccharimonadales bacterium]